MPTLDSANRFAETRDRRIVGGDAAELLLSHRQRADVPTTYAAAQLGAGL
jgi:hypothetical protein